MANRTEAQLLDLMQACIFVPHQFERVLDSFIRTAVVGFIAQTQVGDDVPENRAMVTAVNAWLTRVAGFAKGGATVRLADDGPGATLMTYDVKAQVGGKMAQLGARLIDSTARSMADQFFDRFAARVGGPPPGAEAAAAVAAPAPVPARVPFPVPTEMFGLPTWVWLSIGAWCAIVALMVL